MLQLSNVSCHLHAVDVFGEMQDSRSQGSPTPTSKWLQENDQWQAHLHARHRPHSAVEGSALAGGFCLGLSAQRRLDEQRCKRSLRIHTMQDRRSCHALMHVHVLLGIRCTV